MPLFIDKLAISSPDIDPLGPVPARLSADGGNELPVFLIEGAPDGTVEFAITCHDPDAPLPQGFTHLTAYGIPADAGIVDLAGSALRVGPNGIGQHAWSGPQPPPNHGQHHYYFWVYALDRPVIGTPTREAFLSDYGDAIIEQARLVGTFER